MCGKYVTFLYITVSGAYIYHCALFTLDVRYVKSGLRTLQCGYCNAVFHSGHSSKYGKYFRFRMKGKHAPLASGRQNQLA